MVKSIEQVHGREYLIYHPTGTPKGAILFLHGKGQRGTNIDRLEETGLPKNLKDGYETDYIVVSPQVRENESGWWRVHVGQALEYIRSQYLILKPHITGLSMGGIGVGACMNNFPKDFETFGIVSGWLPSVNSILSDPDKFKDQRVKYWHDLGDDVVGINRNFSAHGALKSMIGNDIDLKAEIFNRNTHGAWNLVYPDLYFNWIDGIEENNDYSQGLEDGISLGRDQGKIEISSNIASILNLKFD